MARLLDRYKKEIVPKLQEKLGRKPIPGDTPYDRILYVLGRMTRAMQREPLLAEAMTRMASDAEMRARFGKAARALVEAKFSAEAIGKETVALYRSLKPA